MTTVQTPTPAGWYKDPGGKHEHRYWDGAAWTGYVADHGVTQLEPDTGASGPPGAAATDTAAAPVVEGATPAAEPGVSFKSRFPADEWELAMALPFLMFGMVASSDDTISDAETQELSNRMSSGALGYKDPLHREVAREFYSTPATADGLLKKAIEAGPARIRDVLKARLTEQEYQGYVGSVWLDALAVAKVEGGLSDKESAALTTDAVFFGLDIEALQHRYD